MSGRRRHQRRLERVLEDLEPNERGVFKDVYQALIATDEAPNIAINRALRMARINGGSS
jgi:hypothetical protein